MNNSQNKNLLTEGSIWKKLMGFAFPLFLGNLFQQLYNTADSLIVGNFLGSDALAAVSSSGSLTFLLVGFFQGLAMGAGVIIARYLAQGRRRSFTGRFIPRWLLVFCAVYFLQLAVLCLHRRF